MNKYMSLSWGTYNVASMTVKDFTNITTLYKHGLTYRCYYHPKLRNSSWVIQLPRMAEPGLLCTQEHSPPCQLPGSLPMLCSRRFSLLLLPILQSPIPASSGSLCALISILKMRKLRSRGHWLYGKILQELGCHLKLNSGCLKIKQPLLLEICHS